VSIKIFFCGKIEIYGRNDLRNGLTTCINGVKGLFISIAPKKLHFFRQRVASKKSIFGSPKPILGGGFRIYRSGCELLWLRRVLSARWDAVLWTFGFFSISGYSLFACGALKLLKTTLKIIRTACGAIRHSSA